MKRLGGVGPLRGLNDALDRVTVERAWRDAGKVDWREWAQANGWTYQGDAPELANTWRDGFDGIEQYRHLMRTTLHGRPVTAFQCIDLRHVGWTGSSIAVSPKGVVVVRLPAPVAEPYASQKMHRTLRHFGAELPARYTAHFRDLDLIAVRNGLPDSGRMQREVDAIARLVAVAPGDLWRH